MRDSAKKLPERKPCGSVVRPVRVYDGPVCWSPHTHAVGAI